MWTRREFVLFSGVGGLALTSSMGKTFAQEESFSICGTLDIDEADGSPKPSVGNPNQTFSIDLKSGTPAPFTITNHGLSARAKRWKKSDGRTPNTGIITLGVHFMNGVPSDYALVEAGARSWLVGGIEKVIDFRFGVPQAEAEISVLFNDQINDSKIGRDSLAFARKEHSMRIHDKKVHMIAHEFGHALCLKHEHQHPASGIVWDEPRVLHDLAPLKYDEAVIRRSIFDKLDTSLVCAASPAFDPNSIMSYVIPPGWDKNGFTSRVPEQISDGDIACVLGVYGG
nr:hypothetical protein [uncultured Devosia sp.]